MPVLPLLLGVLQATATASAVAQEEPLMPPSDFVRDLARSERAAFAVQDDLRATLLAGTARGDRGLASAALVPSFRGRFPAPGAGEEVPDATLAVRRHGADGPLLDREGFLDVLAAHVAGWEAVERAELEADRFWLAAGEESAVARLELRLAGRAPDGGRGDVRVTCDAELVRDDGRWRLARLEGRAGTRVDSPPPRFRDVTAEVGLDYCDSPENRSLARTFVDLQRTFSLGGLSAVDWDRDGFWDLIGTRRGQLAVLFWNDGAGGFVPRPLPFEAPTDCGSFALVVDLDGDGVDELVSSEVQGYEGDRAWCDLWVRDGARWTRRRRAFEFAHPVGLRRISVQTVVPADLDGDQRLDIFFAVYGHELSRGEDYNTVEAHDGGDNHLFLQRDDLTFVEVSDERGITGTQYTYVAQAFDFDADGDTDLFEGNDFGPNVLWRNDGEARFVADTQLGFGSESAYTMGVTLADFDNSGRWSLYVSNMSSEEGARMAPIAAGLSEPMRERVAGIARGNMLFTRDPASGRWIERAGELGCAEGEWAWGCAFFDPDNDGDRDLFVTNGFTSHSDRSLPDWQTYYWRQVIADGGFLERGERSRDVNVDHRAPSSFNGYERDRLFVQPDGSGRFVEAAYGFGLDADHDGRCAVPLDVDGDGDLDLALWTLGGLRLLENAGPPRRFARVALRARHGHPLALGAEVRVTAGGTTQREVLRVVDGFQSQVPTELHFGLGSARSIERLEVRWPSGATGAWDDLPVDLRLEVVEGREEVSATPLPAWPGAARPGGELPELPPPAPEEQGPRIAVVGTGDATTTVVVGTDGRPVRCFRRPVDATDVDPFLALCADEPPFPDLAVMGARLALAEDRPRVAERLALAALAQVELASAHEVLGRVHLARGQPERAEVAYARAVAVDPDYALGHFNLGVTRLQLGRPREAVDALREAVRAGGERPRLLLALGEAASVARDLDTARDAFARATRAAPDDPEAHLKLAKVLGSLRRLEESRASFETALALDPESEEARQGLRLVERLLREH